MNKLLPPVLFLITVAVLAVLAFQSHTVRQKTTQAAQTTIQKQQEAIQKARSELEEVQKIAPSPESPGAEAPRDETIERAPAPPPTPGNKIEVPAPIATKKSAEMSKHIETAHKTLAEPAVNTQPPASQAGASDAQTIDLYMPIVVTGVIGLVALYIILSKKFEAESLKWAYGIIGTIVGFWLKSQ